MDQQPSMMDTSPEALDQLAIKDAMSFAAAVQQFAAMTLRRDGRPGPLEIRANTIVSALGARLSDERRHDHVRAWCGRCVEHGVTEEVRRNIEETDPDYGP